MLDDTKIADMRRGEMQKMVNRLVFLSHSQYIHVQVCLQFPLCCRVGESHRVARVGGGTLSY